MTVNAHKLDLLVPQCLLEAVHHAVVIGKYQELEVDVLAQHLDILSGWPYLHVAHAKPTT